MSSLILFFAIMFGGEGEIGKASTFSIYGDKYNPPNQPLACEPRIIRARGKIYWAKILNKGIAHRTLPCGSKVRIYHIHRGKIISADAYVVDRGPYGVQIKNKWYLRKKLRNGEKYRGIVDVLYPLAKKLKLNGMGYVFLQKYPQNKKIVDNRRCLC